MTPRKSGTDPRLNIVFWTASAEFYVQYHAFSKGDMLWGHVEQYLITLRYIAPAALNIKYLNIPLFVNAVKWNLNIL